MSILNEVISIFYDGNGWDKLAILTLVFRILMLVTSSLFIISLIQYIKRYQIFKAIFLRITGNVREYDRIRRIQIREELDGQNETYTEVKKSTFITKLYKTISKTGIVEKIPGFSESGFLILLCIADIIIGITIGYFKGYLVGILSAIALLIIAWYSLSLIAYERKIKLERQLLQFINACASASMQYANIIDIFGAIYEQFSDPLREGLEACYVEAKKNNNKEVALRHLKERYDSVHFSFIIDNLESCSLATGDYYTVARTIAETVSIYNTSYEKKRVSLKNAKIQISAMLGACICILFMLSQFLGNLGEVLLNTTLGNISIIILLLLYFYGLNIKAEE